MPTPHLHRLTPLADAWRHPITSPGEWFVPGFDPWSGGELSPVLVLMQSPGPATLAQGAHAICSEDNAGPTAKAFRAARIQSGRPAELPALEQRPLGTAPPSTTTDLEQPRPALVQLLEELTGLRAIVTFGGPAWTGVGQQCEGICFFMTSSSVVWFYLRSAPQPGENGTCASMPSRLGKTASRVWVSGR